MTSAAGTAMNVTGSLRDTANSSVSITCDKSHGRGDANRRAHTGQRHAAAQDLSEHLAAGDAQRQPHADRAGTLPDEIRHHAEEADRRERQRHTREGAQQVEVESARAYGLLEQRVYRRHGRERHVRIDRPERRAHVSTDGALDRHTSDIGFHVGYCVTAP
jgi:hypothetical protein